MATSSKCALVVDDSKSARVVLRKMLEKHALQVEAATSAEEAIDFLSRHSPDVIFMDHMMPGMDGFQAIRHIKENPRTAMIPIVMYTSQDGEVYVGQARALGAVDVLAKDIRPTQLNKVLTRLNLVEKGEQPASVAAGAVQTVKPRSANQVRVNLSDAAVQRLARETSDLIRVPEALGVDSDKVHTLLDEQRLNLRQDIASAARNTQGQFGKKFEVLDSRVQYLTELVEKDALEPKVSARSHLAWFVIVILTSLATLYFSTVVFAPQSEVRAPTEDSSELLASLERENETLKSELSRIGNPAGDAGIDRDWLEALQWAVNLSGSYEYTDVPLDDGQLINLQSMVERLLRTGFQGDVVINVHVGDFCLVRNSFDQLEPAGNNTRLGSCDQVSLPADELQAIGLNQSINFANYTAGLQSEAGSPVTLKVVSHGNSKPKVAYPIFDEANSAAQWNRAARQNNRIEFQLINR